jgi:amino acid adenylation domain-containing protein
MDMYDPGRATQPTTEHRHEFPLSHGQRALWYLNQIAPDSAAYNVVVKARIVSPVNASRLGRALRILVERHPSLRTTYRLGAAEPVQIVHPAAAAEVEHVDLRNAPEEDCDKWVNHFADRPFDLERGPVLRAALVQRDEETSHFALAIHHIAIDFQSMEILIGQLLDLYAGIDRGQDRQARSPGINDHVWSEMSLISNAEGQLHLDYWRRTLDDLPILALPTDYRRPAIQTFNGARHTFTLTGALIRDLRALARQRGTTLYVILLSGFFSLLSRYTNETDIVIGSPAAGRSQMEFQDAVGYYTNVVALRVDAGYRPTFTDLVQTVREVVLGALEHQDYPFSLLVEQLQLLRDPSRSPGFQVVFALHPGLQPRIPGDDDLRIEDCCFEQRGAPFDLNVMMAETNGVVSGTFQYNVDLFDNDTIVRMTDHFKILLRSIVAAPERPVAELAIISGSELHNILVKWNATALPFEPCCLPDLVREQAKRTPGEMAIIAHDDCVQYDELDRRADRLARYLAHLGVGPEVAVGVCLDRSVNMIVALIGILRAGGAYVPMDPDYPSERIRFYAQDSGAQVIVTESARADDLATIGIRLVCLDTDAVEIGQLAESPTGPQATPANAAYIIYTSGSTGTPKGVVVEHRSVAAFLEWARRAFSADERAGVLASTSICFDLSIFEIFLPLTTGGTIILAQNLLELGEVPAANQVRLVNTVPSVMAEFLRFGRWPEGVRTVSLCGEPLNQSLVDALYTRPGVERVINLYGPTESTIYATVATVEPAADCPPSIGRPIANTQVYVLDTERQPVPPGVTGELYLGGAGLARGYLDRPELTAEHFVPNPFSAATDDRLYRTGDLGRFRRNGEIEFLGRADNQVKVRGFRIELGEIETLLGRHPDVQEVAVTASPGYAPEPRLAAYIVARAGVALTGSEFRGYLSKWLPTFMIPQDFVFLPMLPRTFNGKIDRAALPERHTGSPNLEIELVPPRNALEKQLVDIWQQSLGVNQIGVHDDFFEVGGNSIQSLQIAAKARELGLDLAPELLFAYPTIGSLAIAIGRRNEAAWRAA